MLGVVLFDLDGFKFINDTYGHAAGDEVLQRMGEALRTNARSGEILARLGGDEFAVLLLGPSRTAVRLRVEALLQVITSTSVQVASQHQPLQVTAGLSFAAFPLPPADAPNTGPATPEQLAQSLLACADTALVRGKKLEKGRLWLAEAETEDIKHPQQVLL